MFHQLVNLNDDLRRLVEKGYALAIDSGYLVIRDTPYLDAQKELQWGAIVAKLEFVDKHTVKQSDHQIFFAGSVPYGLDGNPIPNLGGGAMTLALGEASKDVVVQRSFSNKPTATGKFADFFDKIESYVGIISGPAMELHGANPYTFRTVETIPDSVFKLHDTLTSRAEITDLSAKFANDVVAVIGVGGTGAYLLDFLVKTPVREIRAFDFDYFHVHNAFRSPGRLEESELGKPKADVYAARYESFRHGLKVERKFIDSSSVADLEGVTFAFVCVDKGSARSAIFDLLIAKGIPFIDVGMGLNRKRGPVNGMMRVTYYSVENAQKVREMGLAEMTDQPDDIYRTNIQISEINALNACLAVIRFKQLRGFYFEEIPYYQLLLDIGDIKVVGDWELEWKFVLQRVQYMPKDLKPGVLYVSEEFDIAMHLCPCGCGSKVKTPLGPTEWSVEETKSGPSLRPSVGNWQQVCQSHYWINRGEIKWADKWTPEQIAAGRRYEGERRQAYYNALDRERGRAMRFWRWMKSLFNR